LCRLELQLLPDGVFAFFGVPLALVEHLLDAVARHILYEDQASAVVIPTDPRMHDLLLGLKQAHA
jgi:hypothetical protein